MPTLDLRCSTWNAAQRNKCLTGALLCVAWSPMPKHTLKTSRRASETEAGNKFGIRINYWAHGAEKIEWINAGGRAVTQLEWLAEMRHLCGGTAAKASAEIGVSQRTFEGWLLGRPVSVAMALRIQEAAIRQRGVAELMFDPADAGSSSRGIGSTPPKAEPEAPNKGKKAAAKKGAKKGGARRAN